MKFSLIPLVALALSVAASPTPADLLPRADGYCNKDRSVTGVGGYVVKYPALGSGTATCIMNKGAEGAGVKALQTSLNHCYGNKLSVDGDYGDKTKAAVKAAQGKIGGLDKDGIWGPKTGAKMEWWGSKKVAQGTETAWSCVKAIL